MNDRISADILVLPYSGEMESTDGDFFAVVSPTTGDVACKLLETPAADVSRIVAASQQAFIDCLDNTSATRSAWLSAAADAMERASAEIVELIVTDLGKPVRVATGEVRRSIEFVRACAREVLSIGGEVLPLESMQAGAGHFGYTVRVPVGVVAGITPFNAPANLLCQKVAPALAMGNAIVVKPHPSGTRAAIRIAQAFREGGLPAGLFSVVTGDRAAAASLVAENLVRVVSFTGGNAAAEALSRAAGCKKFLSELGSNSANVVLGDADLESAAKKIAAAAFEASGQQCVSAQRVIVEASVYDSFLGFFVDAAKALKVGAASDPATDIGPMVSKPQADRVMQMARDAIADGATYALEPRQDGAIVSPGILRDAPRSSAIWCAEVFGPLAVVEKAADMDEALRLANDSEFGLQGSLFTRSLDATFLFARRFDVGALWINEASRYRLDLYPFGGMKKSGSGRDGVKYAMEELSQLKFIGINLQR